MKKKKRTQLSQFLKEMLFGGQNDPGDRLHEDRLFRLIEINTVLNSELNLKRLLNLILDSVIELNRAERGFIITWREDHMVIEAARNIDKEEIQRADSKVSSGVINRVLKEGVALLTDSAVEDEELSQFTSVTDMKLRSILCTPLKAKDTVIGCVYIDNRFQKGSFSEEDRLLLNLFSDQAAIAVENARLYAENEGARIRLKELNQALETKVENQAIEIRSIREALESHQEEMKLRYDYSSIVSRSRAMQDLFRLMDRVTDTDYPVLISGESGTGKELVAKAIHYNGQRGSKRFVTENCAAISESLLESELFGYEKGAFTGADSRKIGLFELAHEGTLFLDEIGEMELNMQKKLLRVLQEKEFRRVGGRETISVDARILSATNANLADLIEKNRFREDLFYRLKVVSIRLPPLRERLDDIPLLVDTFLAEIAREQDVEPKTISSDALDILMRYSWPGNVRELKNEIHRLALISEQVITKKVVCELTERGVGGGGTGHAGYSGKTLVEVEKAAILGALEEAGGNKALTARKLAIPRRTLYNRLKRYGIE